MKLITSAAIPAEPVPFPTLKPPLFFVVFELEFDPVPDPVPAPEPELAVKLPLTVDKAPPTSVTLSSLVPAEFKTVFSYAATALIPTSSNAVISPSQPRKMPFNLLICGRNSNVEFEFAFTWN
jgi:hypothetical protein